ncbi:hypothetical protein STEG23_027480, partial [Scotinomys teguina]
MIERSSVTVGVWSGRKKDYVQSFPSDEGWPFAKYLGACGRMVAVNYVGEELWSYFNAPWEKRVDLAWQLMEIAEQLTNNDFEFALYLLDVSFDNFAVGPRDGKVIIVDAENVLVADKRLIRQNKPENWDVWYESKFDDCDKEACLSFSKEILCARVTVDHNYYAVCQNLLSRHATWRGTSGGLLHDPPSEVAKDGRLEALLDECANPKKRYGRFQAAKELRGYLAQLSHNSSLSAHCDLLYPIAKYQNIKFKYMQALVWSLELTHLVGLLAILPLGSLAVSRVVAFQAIARVQGHNEADCYLCARLTSPCGSHLQKAALPYLLSQDDIQGTEKAGVDRGRRYQLASEGPEIPTGISEFSVLLRAIQPQKPGFECGGSE